MASDRPGLASADARRRRPADPAFDAMLAAACREPVAAAALAEAYAGLEPTERRSLRETIARDGRRLGLDIGPVLAAFAAIERDPWVRRRARQSFAAWEGPEEVVVQAPGLGAIEARANREEPIRVHADWSPAPRHRAVELERAVDRLAQAMWDARRAGERWPADAGAFAELFDSAPSPR